MSQTTLTGGDTFTPLAGWPCVPLLGGAPPLEDILANPSADELLPQILTLTPRGAAWGTDNYGDGKGASPNLLALWAGLSAWSAASYARDFDVYKQVFPSEITWSLDNWESEYALPDPCITDAQTTAERLQAVRVKYALVGATSPRYLICLAASLGYVIFVEEYRPAQIGDRIGDRLYGRSWGDVFKVHAPVTTVVPARIGAHIGDRLASWGNAELECAIDAAKEPQTIALFAYDVDPEGGALDLFTLDDGGGIGDPLSDC